MKVLWKRSVYADFRAICLKVWGHTRKLGKITVFYELTEVQGSSKSKAVVPISKSKIHIRVKAVFNYDFWEKNKQEHPLNKKLLNPEFYSGLCFLLFGLDKRIYFSNLCVLSKCGKIQTRQNFEFSHFSRSEFFLNCFQSEGNSTTRSMLLKRFYYWIRFFIYA